LLDGSVVDYMILVFGCRNKKSGCGMVCG